MRWNLFHTQKKIEHLTSYEEWLMQYIWNHKGDYSSKELLMEVNKDNPKLSRVAFITLLQLCAEKGYLKCYREGRTTFIHCLIDIVDVDKTANITMAN